MKIWTNNSTEEVVLCDHGRGGPSNFAPQVVRRKDVLSFVQGTFAKPRARGNAYRVWSFSVKIDHASISAAQLYLLTLHQTVPSQVDMMVELEDRGLRYILPDCVIEFSAAAPLGVLTTVSWMLTFGVMDLVAWWLGELGFPVFFDGIGIVNASGAPKPALDPAWNWPASPALGDYVFADSLGAPAWNDGTGWINATGAPMDAHTKPAPDGGYTRPVEPTEGDMEYDAFLQVPIWFSSGGWINATGATV